MVQAIVPTPVFMDTTRAQLGDAVDDAAKPAEAASVTSVPSLIFVSTIVLAADDSANPAESFAFA